MYEWDIVARAYPIDPYPEISSGCCYTHQSLGLTNGVLCGMSTGVSSARICGSGDRGLKETIIASQRPLVWDPRYQEGIEDNEFRRNLSHICSTRRSDRRLWYAPAWDLQLSEIRPQDWLSCISIRFLECPVHRRHFSKVTMGATHHPWVPKTVTSDGAFQ